MQCSVQFNLTWILQLIDDISNDLQKILKYFDGTIIFVFFEELFVLLTASEAFPTRAALYLNDLDYQHSNQVLLAGTSSLFNCHKLLHISG